MRRWIVIVASLGIVLLLVRAAGFRHVAEVWRSVEPGGIALSVACYFASLAVRVLSWRRLLAPDAPGFASLAPPLALGFVLGHVTPAKSGEPASALLVSRAFGLPASRTLSVLTAERAVQLVLLLATFVPAAAWTAGRVLELEGAVPAAAAVLGVLAAGLLCAPALLRRARGPLSRLPRIGDAVARYADTLAELLADRGRMIPLAALAAAFWVLQYLSLWAILDAGGASVNLAGAAAVSGAAILGGTLTMLPLGTQDGISAVVLAGLGVPTATGFSLALFHTLLSLGCGMAVVAVAPWWLRQRT